MLNERIRKLERDGAIVRHAYRVIPPRIEYEFTDRGQRLLAVVRLLAEFARDWR